MKQTLTFVFRSMAFVLIFVLLLSLSENLFVPKGNAPEDGIHDHKQNSFLGEAPDSLDVVIVGNSLGQCGFSPLDIWEGYGITVQNCSSGNQKMYQSRDFLQEVFRHHSPKIVIMEPDTVMNTCSTLELLQYQMEKWFLTLRYHDRWKIMGIEDLLGEISYSYTDDLKGYHYESDARPSGWGEYMIPTEEVSSIWEKNYAYMDEIMQLCEENGAQLLFVSIPSPACWVYAEHNAIANLSEQIGATYLDLNLMDIGIDWDTDTYDRGNHLNYAGAQKVADFIGQYLTDAGLFSDKRGLPAYAGWDEALNRFRDSIA